MIEVSGASDSKGRYTRNVFAVIFAAPIGGRGFVMHACVCVRRHRRRRLECTCFSFSARLRRVATAQRTLSR